MRRGRWAGTGCQRRSWRSAGRTAGAGRGCLRAPGRLRSLQQRRTRPGHRPHTPPYFLTPLLRRKQKEKRTDKIIFFILHCLYYLTFTTYSLPVQSRTPILLIRTTTFPGKFLLPWDVGKQSFSIALPSVRVQWQSPQE